MRTPSLNENPLVDIVRRLQVLERGTSLGFSSITRGALRVASAEGLIVEGSQRVSGTLLVTGTETVEGTLRVNGHLIVAGDMNITGPTIMSGTFDIDGDTTINGDTDIHGALNLTGTMTVTGSGQIIVGNMLIGPAVGGGGGITPTSGALYLGGPGGVKLAENVEVIASLNVGENLVNPGMASSTNADYKQVVVNTTNGRLYYRP